MPAPGHEKVGGEGRLADTAGNDGSGTIVEMVMEAAPGSNRGPRPGGERGEPVPHADRISSPPGRLPYLPGLDGLRALAVVAVLFYHGHLDGFAGGFLGVEVFFVISGYLITALLLAERERTGSISLRDFWIRRARRLLPALFVFLIGAVLLAAVFAEDAVTRLRQGILGALFYVANWDQLARGESYAEAFARPSFLQHLWSLAVEEQFYLVWPVAVFLGLRHLGRRRFLLTTVGVAVASILWMWLLAVRLDDFADPTRIYYGTDTRLGGLLLGAALAFVWRPWTAPTAAAGLPARLRIGAELAGLSALALVLWAFTAFDFSQLPTDVARLFPWGFLLTATATAVLIAAVVVPGSWLARALGNPLLRWIGVRSYGIYLWHFPVFQLTRPRVDVDLGGWQLWGVRLTLTAIVVELSYQLVERPVRERRFFATLVNQVTKPARVVATRAATVVIALVVVAIGIEAPRISQRDAVAAGADGVLNADAVEEAVILAPEDGLAPGSTGVAPSSGVLPAQEGQPTTVPGEGAASPGQPATTPAAAPAAEPLTSRRRVTFIGDSVLEGASPALLARWPKAVIDARRGRQWWDLEAELQVLLSSGELRKVVVIHLGNNGTLTDEIFDGVMGHLTDRELVVFVNVRVPKEWESEVNGALARNVGRYPNAALLDWNALANTHPEWFADDGVHMGGAGAEAYASLVSQVIPSD